MKRLLFILLLAAAFAVPSIAQAKVWNYTPITSGATPGYGQRSASMDGKDVVWTGFDEKKLMSIMHYDQSTGETRNLSLGKLPGVVSSPHISNGLVTFRAYDSRGSQKQNYYVYDLSTDTLTQIYSADKGTFDPISGYPPSYHSLDPMIHNGEVVFSAWDGNNYQIMTWNNGEIKQITHGNTDSYEPQIWNGQLCWTGWGGDDTAQDVFYYDGKDIHQITSRLGKDEDTFIADGKIAWTGQSPELGSWGFNIYSYDIETGETKLEYIGPGNDYEPALYQNTLGWAKQTVDPSTGKASYTVWYSDGYKVDQLHYGDNPDREAIEPYLHKDTVVFGMHNDKGAFEIVLASYKTGGYNPQNFEGHFMDALTVGDIAYTAQGVGGIGVYDLSDPNKPKLIGKAQTLGNSFSLAQHGERLFSASRDGGLEVFAIGSDGMLSRSQTVQVEGSPNNLLVNNEKLFVSGREGGLSIVDLASQTLSVIGHVALPGLTMGLDILNNIAYVGGYTAGLHLVDISDPTNPTLLSTLSNIGKVWDVNIHNGTAFLSIAGYGLLAYDLNNPLTPIKIGDLEMPNGNLKGSWEATFEMVIREHIAFVSAGTQGIFAVDISDPTQMRIIERYETPEFAWSAAIFDKYLLGSDYTGGFNLYDVTDHLPGLGQPQTPIPGAIWLLGSGIAGLGWLRKKKKMQ